MANNSSLILLSLVSYFFTYYCFYGKFSSLFNRAENSIERNRFGKNSKVLGGCELEPQKTREANGGSRRSYRTRTEIRFLVSKSRGYLGKKEREETWCVRQVNRDDSPVPSSRYRYPYREISLPVTYPSNVGCASREGFLFASSSFSAAFLSPPPLFELAVSWLGGAHGRHVSLKSSYYLPAENVRLRAELRETSKSHARRSFFFFFYRKADKPIFLSSRKNYLVHF